MTPRFQFGVYCRQRLIVGLLILFCWIGARAEDSGKPSKPVSPPGAVVTQPPLADVLPPEKWQQVENSVDRALAWLSTQQAADGSFLTLPTGQPAVTSLCVLAFLSRGHQPGHGPYGDQINRAIDYVISCQRADGLFSYEPPAPVHEDMGASHTAVYNHAISGLMLGEVYGHVSGKRAHNTRGAIEKALRFTRTLQMRRKQLVDTGGWRYLWLRSPKSSDSDLSVTAWQLMFLRSARNAEFNIPQGFVDDAMEFVHRCWDPDKGIFNYANKSGWYGSSRGMMGAGILSLSMAGQHQTQMAQTAGDWLLAHPYDKFGEQIGPYDRYFYSMYYCSQAAAQLGGRYWAGFFPPLAQTLLSVQAFDGSWPSEPNNGDGVFGRAYTTALAVLSLTPPYQLLPVYQR